MTSEQKQNLLKQIDAAYFNVASAKIDYENYTENDEDYLPSEDFYDVIDAITYLEEKIKNHEATNEPETAN